MSCDSQRSNEITENMMSFEDVEMIEGLLCS